MRTLRPGMGAHAIKYSELLSNIWSQSLFFTIFSHLQVSVFLWLIQPYPPLLRGSLSPKPLFPLCIRHLLVVPRLPLHSSQRAKAREVRVGLGQASECVGMSSPTPGIRPACCWHVCWGFFGSDPWLKKGKAAKTRQRLITSGNRKLESSYKKDV